MPRGNRIKPGSLILEDDGEIDWTAVEIALSRRRRVALTASERREVLIRLIRREDTMPEMAQSLALSIQQVKVLLTEHGYELVPGGVSGGYFVILPVDRPRRREHAGTSR